MSEQWKLMFQIFWTFFKISPVTFGGGFAMIPLIEREIVEKRKWLESEDVTDVFALSQSVLGAIAINSATFIGHRIAGIKGALAAMMGVSLPTFFIVLSLGISYFFVHDNPKLEAAFVSIRATIVAIIVYAAINRKNSHYRQDHLHYYAYRSSGTVFHSSNYRHLPGSFDRMVRYSY